MRTAAGAFYLAVFGLLGSSHASDGVSVSASPRQQPASSNVCAVSRKATPTVIRLRDRTHRTFSQYEPHTIVSDACASYSTLEDLNTGLHPYIHQITHDTDFFSHYRLNLFNKECPFWSDADGMCGNIACAVNTLENEEDIPLAWRADQLGKLEGPKAEHPGKKLQQERPAARPLQGQLGEEVGESCVVEYDDECDERDYCMPEDESATSKGDYVSLVDNPERFTGYSGPSANQVWEAIYRENCFHKTQPEKLSNGHSTPPGSSSPFGNQLQAQAAQDLRNVMREHNDEVRIQQAIAARSTKTPVDELDFDDECVEKRVFYRIISGMHASISTHLCWDYLNKTTGQWGPNLECYQNRLHTHPERISNMYFNYALLLRAVAKVRPHLNDYSFCSADPQQDRHTKQLVLSLSSAIGRSTDIFDESVMFKSQDAIGLKEDFKARFRNVSRVMDCVGCDKCRLWGKVQTTGYATALKILFEFDDTNPAMDPPLRRTELVALLNTLDRLSHSLHAVKDFTKMIDGSDAVAGHAPTRSTIRTSPTSQITSNKSNLPSEDDGLGEPPKRRQRYHHEELTASELFWDELDLVWRTYVYVLRSWVEFPVKAFRIAVWETGRLWNSFIGIKVPDRNWEIRVPSHDEF